VRTLFRARTSVLSTKKQKELKMRHRPRSWCMPVPQHQSNRSQINLSQRQRHPACSGCRSTAQAFGVVPQRHAMICSNTCLSLLDASPRRRSPLPVSHYLSFVWGRLVVLHRGCPLHPLSSLHSLPSPLQTSRRDGSSLGPHQVIS
jgi:hypothetical protein